MKILIVTAMQSEFETIAKMLKIEYYIQGLESDVYASIVNEVTRDSITLVCSGPGCVNAASAVSRWCCSHKPDYIINIGYVAGTKRSRIGDVFLPVYTIKDDVVVSEEISELVCSHNLQQVLLPYTNASCCCLTSDKFVDGKHVSDRVKFPAGEMYPSQYLFDMELASIAQVAKKYAVPVVSIKVVSDIPELHTGSSFNQFEDSVKRELLLNCKTAFDHVIGSLQGS
jgi:nucleoside phosphorylase